MKNSEDPHMRLLERLQHWPSERQYCTLESFQETQTSCTFPLGDEEYVNFSSSENLNLFCVTLLPEKRRSNSDEYGTGSTFSWHNAGILSTPGESEGKSTSRYQNQIEEELLFCTTFQAVCTILPPAISVYRCRFRISLMSDHKNTGYKKRPFTFQA